MYVARYTNTPDEDIKRGWSGVLGGGITWKTLDDWAADAFVGPEWEDDIDERQRRWINTWGESTRIGTPSQRKLSTKISR